VSEARIDLHQDSEKFGDRLVRLARCAGSSGHHHLWMIGSCTQSMGVGRRDKLFVPDQPAIDNIYPAMHLRSQIEIVGYRDHGFTMQRNQILQDPEHLRRRDGIEAASGLVREPENSWPSGSISVQRRCLRRMLIGTGTT
jgi:hypothetical protein